MLCCVVCCTRSKCVWRFVSHYINDSVRFLAKSIESTHWSWFQCNIQVPLIQSYKVARQKCCLSFDFELFLIYEEVFISMRSRSKWPFRRYAICLPHVINDNNNEISMRNFDLSCAITAYLDVKVVRESTRSQNITLLRI